MVLSSRTQKQFSQNFSFEMGLLNGKGISPEGRHESAPQFRKYRTPKKSAIRLHNSSQKPCFFKFVDEQKDNDSLALRVNDSFESYMFSAPSTRRSLKPQESMSRSKQEAMNSARRGGGEQQHLRLDFEIKGSSVNIQQHPSSQHSQRSKQYIHKSTKNSLIYPRNTTPAYCDRSISLYQNSVSCLSSSKEDIERDGLLSGRRLDQASERLQSQLHTPTTSSKLN